MILKFCATDITKLTSPALPSFPAHLYAFQFHELSFCCPFIMKQKQKNNKSTNEAWIDQQSNVCRRSKCTLQSLPELCGTPNPKNYSYAQSLKWQSFRAYKLAYGIFHSLPLLLPVNLEILTYELTSFLRQYDVFSFCVRREYSASMTQKRGLDWTQGLTPLAKINHGD